VSRRRRQVRRRQKEYYERKGKLCKRSKRRRAIGPKAVEPAKKGRCLAEPTLRRVRYTVDSCVEMGNSDALDALALSSSLSPPPIRQLQPALPRVHGC